jgi:hypothetical protein
MIKFYTWFNNNRYTIGLVVGVLNIIAGLGNLLIGGLLTAVLQLSAGAVILIDAWFLGQSNEEH